MTNNTKTDEITEDTKNNKSIKNWEQKDKQALFIHYKKFHKNILENGLSLSDAYKVFFIEEEKPNKEGSRATCPNIDSCRLRIKVEMLSIEASSSSRTFDFMSNHRYPRILLKFFVPKESSRAFMAEVSVHVSHP